jgi:hypothetical protein
MRFLNAPSTGAVCAEPEWAAMLPDAVLIAPPVVVAPAPEAGHVTGQGRP